MSKQTPQQSLDQLINAAREDDMQPRSSRDLWPGIEHHLQRRVVDKPQRRSWLALTWATAACLVLAVGGVTFYGMQSPQLAQQAPQVALLTMLNQQHEQQRQQLVTHYQTVGMQQTSSYVDAELQQLRTSIQTVSAQLVAEPDNQALWQLLQWLYDKELELLSSQFTVSNSKQLQQI
ncbi:hypothetical protein [Pseudidiomarina salilacus]|uniref:hypothetical protein n=1 Tax=Pseudidiomarina salilacus TaxID=3384452 RepID=UPI003984FAEE